MNSFDWLSHCNEQFWLAVQQDVSITTEITGGNAFKTVLNYGREAATFEGHFIDECTGDSIKYRTMIHLVHPNSLIDVQMG